VCGDALAREPYRWGDGRVHGVLGAAFGWCTRTGFQVGGNVVCAETTLGMDVSLPRRHDLHWLTELGFGGVGSIRWGYDTQGEQTSTGGGSFVVRTLFGRDFISSVPSLPPWETAVLFWRFGGEFKPMWAFGRWTYGVHGVVDIGTRVVSRFELGLRVLAGADTVRVAGSDYSAVDWTFMVGTQIFTRFVIR